MIPKILEKNINDIYGEKGRQWLLNLPDLLKRFERLWDFKLGHCFADANFNYVAPITLENGTSAVLKCGMPSPEFSREIAALEYFAGMGAVCLLTARSEEGVMLLERINPGTLLEKWSDEDQATLYAVELLNKLHKPVSRNTLFPTLADWFKGFDKLYSRFNGATGPFPAHLVNKACSISNELLNSMNEPVLLHGDLHYANVIFSEEKGWVAIDPKGVIGEREFETPFPRLGDTVDHRLLKHRLERLIEFSGFDKQRVIGWMFAKAMLAAWWTFEDSQVVVGKFICCAEAIEKLLSY